MCTKCGDLQPPPGNPCSCKKEFKVGQVWVSSTNRKHNIISVEHDLIVTRSDDINVYTWYPDGRSRPHSHVALIKEYKEPQTVTQTIYMWKSKTSGTVTINRESPLGYNAMYYDLVGKKEVTITEGEGM